MKRLADFAARRFWTPRTNNPSPGGRVPQRGRERNSVQLDNARTIEIRAMFSISPFLFRPRCSHWGHLMNVWYDYPLAIMEISIRCAEHHPGEGVSQVSGFLHTIPMWEEDGGLRGGHPARKLHMVIPR